MLFALSIFLKYVLIPFLMISPIVMAYFFCEEKKEPALYSAGILGMLLGVSLNVFNLWPNLFSALDRKQEIYALASITVAGFLIFPISKILLHRFVLIDSILVLIMSGIGFTLFSSYAVFDNGKYDSYFIAGILSFAVGILFYVMLFHRTGRKY